ncbi:MAG: aldehyde ferredoxin oxidoreductase family protein [Bacillota bacterium]
MAETAYVDLTSKTVRIEPSNEQYLLQFIGSRGYAARLLYDLAGPATHPLGPENPLVFSPGPLTGTSWPCSARYTVTAKSPLTGVYGYANASGFFGPELRHAGYDAIVISGRAVAPVYILIQDDQIEFRDASDLWGRDTHSVEAELRQRHPGSRVSGIGPAGERLVRIAAIINDYNRAAARCGLGAVMGSKNLKCLVVRGTRRSSLPPAFRSLAKEAMTKVRSNPGTAGLTKYGTAVLVRPKNLSGDLPTRNHQKAQFALAHQVDGQALSRYVVRNQGCFACPIRCSRQSVVPEGKYQCEVEGPEYETINALGPMCENSNLESLIYGNLLCNQLGLDTISTGSVIAFAMECAQHGLLAGDGLSLQWGDPDTVVGLIRQIAYRQGIGDLLAEGVKRASERIPGSEDFALHVKGMELPRQEPRVARGFGLGHATSNRGADHLYALPTIDVAGMYDVAKKLFPQEAEELMEVPSEKHKALMVRYTEHFNAIADAAGICKFSTTETYALYPEEVAEGLSALGLTCSAQELLTAGERIVNLERLFNVGEGLDRRHDLLPRRFTHEPLDVYAVEFQGEEASITQRVLRRGMLIDIDTMLDEYYALRGWDQNGIPTPATRRRLGLDFVR